MCNCNNNPCSCPNADCNCPPDYSIAPAMINCSGTTCEDTMETACIFTSNYLNCSRIPIGTSLDATLQILDAKICSCGSCTGVTANTSTTSYDGAGLPCIGVSGTTSLNTILSDIDTKLCSIGNALQVYYVDTNNTQAGNGSVVNPFQTIAQAYNKIMSLPNPSSSNITVSVAGGIYNNVTTNIYIPSTTWIFAPGAIVNFTGSTTYFIDSSTFPAGSKQFQLSGALTFNTSTGGFLKQAGTSNGSYPNKDMAIQCFTISGTTPILNYVPLINLALTDTGNSVSGNAQPNISMEMTTGGSIISAYQDGILMNGGYLSLDLGGGQFICGQGPGITTTTGYILNYNDAFTSGFATIVTFIIQNGIVGSTNATAIMSIAGTINEFVISNIQAAPIAHSGVTHPQYFANIGNVAFSLGENVTVYNDVKFLFKELYLDPSCFTAGATSVINYNQSGSTLEYLQMQECILLNPLTISNNINLGATTTPGIAVATTNILNSLLRFTQIPGPYANNVAAKVALGNAAGVLYQTSTGQLMITF